MSGRLGWNSEYSFLQDSRERGRRLQFLRMSHWVRFSILLSEFVNFRKIFFGKESSVDSMTADKLYVLYLQLYPELLKGSPYKKGRFLWGPMPYDPRCDIAIEEEKKQGIHKTRLSQHMAEFCLSSEPPFLRYEENRFVPNVTEENILHWGNTKLFNLEERKRIKSMAAVCSTLNNVEIQSLAEGLTLNEICLNINRDLRDWPNFIYPALRNYSHYITEEQAFKIDDSVREAGKSTSAAIEKASHYEKNLQNAVERIKEAMKELREYKEGIEKFLQSIQYEPNSPHFIKRKHTAEILNKHSTFTRNVVNRGFDNPVSESPDPWNIDLDELEQVLKKADRVGATRSLSINFSEFKEKTGSLLSEKNRNAISGMLYKLSQEVAELTNLTKLLEETDFS